MAYIECNTKKIKTYGEDIVALANEFDDIITSLFNLLNNISTNGIWVGDNAEEYVASIIKEKDLYTKLGVELKKIGLTYQLASNILDNKIYRAKEL